MNTTITIDFFGTMLFPAHDQDLVEVFEDLVQKVTAFSKGTTPVIIQVPDEEVFIFLDNGCIILSKDEYPVKVISACEYWDYLEEIFTSILSFMDVKTDNYMHELAMGNKMPFGWPDYFVAYKVDEGYQRNKMVQFQEDAMIIGSTRVPGARECKTLYSYIGYTSTNEDYYDFGITRSGKFFTVQKGQIMYWTPNEFQMVLEQMMCYINKDM